jgi:hypothetical protein
VQNKAIRTQLEEAEQALHQRRSQRFDAQQPIANGPAYDDLQSKLTCRHYEEPARY